MYARIADDCKKLNCQRFVENVSDSSVDFCKISDETNASIIDENFWENAEVFSVCDDLNVYLFKSKRSKLRVAVIDVSGPVVDAHISIVTETNTNDGLPHALEHLVFTESQNYPYPFDSVANLCISSGSNAWTCQDHTCYVVSTIGSEGFLKALPAYLDYILSPALTESWFLTEVHHINGNGENAGVLYCEMQDHEASHESIIDRRTREILFKEGNPYRVDTGGRLVDIRQSCNLEKIRDFHKNFYHLDNMLITIFGTIDHSALLRIIADAETPKLKDIPPYFTKPFNVDSPEIVESHQEEIFYPSSEEEFGIVKLVWKGANSTDIWTSEALHILLDYLADTIHSPIQMDFTQLEEPYAGCVEFNTEEFISDVISLTFEGVPIEKLPKIHERLMNKTIAEHCQPENFKISRMKDVINNSKKTTIAMLEDEYVDIISDALISHQIYGNRLEKDLELRLNSFEILEKLLEMDADFWTSLVKQYFTVPHICIIARPSIQLSEINDTKESERITEQCTSLDMDGLKCKADILENAIQKNSSKKPSNNDKNLFSLSKLRINKHEITSTTRGKHQIFDLFSFNAFIHEIQTKLTRVYVMFDTKNIPLNLRLWLEVYQSLLFTSPCEIDGEVVPHEEVSSRFNRDLIQQSVGLGLPYDFEKRYLVLMLETEKENADYLVKWAEIFLKKIVFCFSRVTIAIQEIMTKSNSLKDDGSYVCVSLIDHMIYRKDTNEILDFYFLEDFHKDVAKKSSTNDESILCDLKLLQNYILKAPITLHFSCPNDVFNNEKLLDVFKKFTCISDSEGCLYSDDKIHISASAMDLFDPQAYGVTKILPLLSSESSFMLQAIVFDHGWNMDILMPVLLFCEYLSMQEGIIWKSVRGRGLAYDAAIYVHDPFQLRVSIYRCAQLKDAYKKLKDSVLKALDEDMNMHYFESAKRTLISCLIEKEGNKRKAVIERMKKVLVGIDFDFTSVFCQHIWKAKGNEVRQKSAVYLRKLFDEDLMCRAIVVPPSKSNEIKHHFKKSITVQPNDLILKQF